MKESFPCIKVEQPIGEFYLASIKASILRKFCFSRVASYDGSSVSGSQREINDARVNEIGRYLKTPDASIPNTIILSANYREDDSLVVEPNERWEYEDGKIVVPNSELKICSIIDGQHRLKGFDNIDVDMDLPCSIFIDLPPSMQAYVFSTINFNQKKVDKSLAYQLFGYQVDESDSDLWSPDILAIKISRVFQKDGPFKGRIRIIGQSSMNDSWTVSSASFIEGVLSLITPNSKNDKYEISKKGIIGYSGRKSLKRNKRYPLRDFYLDSNDLAIEMVLDRYFRAIERSFWNGKEPGSIIFRTIGISAQFKFLKYILEKELVTLNRDLEFDSMLNCLNDSDFPESNPIFSARTATTKLLVDYLKVACLSDKQYSKEEISPEILKIFC